MNGSFVTESFSQPAGSFNDAGYASSAYSSSAIDPLSPRPQQQQGGALPTLFEEPTPPLEGHNVWVGGGGGGETAVAVGNRMVGSRAATGAFPEPFDGTSILLHATAGAENFHDPNYDLDFPLSPRQQLLESLGPDVPASIVETGVAACEVAQYISELSETDNKYSCQWPACGRRFGRKENVRAHVQTHLGDRQFKCNLCDKTFVRQHDLKRHIAIHSDDRPHVCPCGTGFARHDALTRHRQRGMCPGALPGFEKSEEEKPKRGRPKKGTASGRPGMEERTEKAGKQRRKNASKSKQENDDDDLQVLYASSHSSSGASERSFPVTPPQDSSDAFDADVFLNMANTDIAYNAVTSSWRDTPPTSPVSPTRSTKTADGSVFDFNVPITKQSPSTHSHYSSPTPPADQGAENFSYASPSASGNAGSSSSFYGGSVGDGSSPANEMGDEMMWFDGAQDTVQANADAVFGDVFSPAGESNSSSSAYGYSDNDDLFEKELVSFVTSGQGQEGMFATAGMGMAMPGARDEHLESMLDEWISAN